MHGAGLSGVNWHRLAADLTPFCRPVSYDLPGHGHSTAPMRDAADLWPSVVTVAEGMGLDHPIVVGHDTGVWGAMVATIHRPELFSAAVLLGATVARTTPQAHEHAVLMSDPGLQQMFTERFLLGRTADDEAARDDLVARIAALSAQDWLLDGVGDSLDLEAAHRVVPRAEGGWIHLPTVETVAHTALYPEADYPDERLYPRVTVPTTIVQLSDGFDQSLHERERALVADLPLIETVPLISGQWPQHSAPDQLAAIIKTVVHRVS